MAHDPILQHAVTAGPIWDPTVTSSEIGITAKDGSVALTGWTGTTGEKLVVEAAGRRIRG